MTCCLFRACACAALALLLPVPVAAAQSWTQHQGDERHTGYVPAHTDAAQLQPIWSLTSEALGINQPVRGAVTWGDRVYFTGTRRASDYRVYGVDKASGEVQWMRMYDPPGVGVSAPAVSADGVFVHSHGHSATTQGPEGDPRLIALQHDDGETIFSTRHRGSTRTNGRPTVEGEQVFVPGAFESGGMDAYDAQTGDIQWSTSLPGQSGWLPGIDDEHAYVYFSSGGASPGPPDNTLYTIDRQTGDKQARTFVGPGFGASTSGTPVLTDNGSLLFVTNTDEPTRLFRLDLDAPENDWVLAEPYLTDRFAIDDDLIYIGSRSRVLVVDEQDGSVLDHWDVPIGEPLMHNLVLTQDVFFATTEFGTYAVDRASLETVWHTDRIGDLTYGDGVLLISHFSGVHAFAVPEPALGGVALLTAIGLRTRRRQR